MKTSILILGSSGLVGSRFVDLLAVERQSITPKSVELDITDRASLNDFIKRKKDNFDVVINFAAITNVDEIEKERGNEKGMVWQVNVEGAANVAEAAKKHDKFLVHISTDLVFSGSEEDPGPYAEDSKLPENLNRISWYGWTKLMGEKKVRELNKNSAIVRISYPFRSHYTRKIDFARNILQLFDEGKLYPMSTDQLMTPTFIDEAASAIEEICELEKPETFHLASSDTITPYEFANYLLEKARGAKNVVKKGLLKEFLKAPGRTPIPIFGGLDTKKTQRILGMKFKTWKQAVDEFIEQLNG
ncbi:MAG: NAD(P)-dependent oxidoreductase [Microgenomates group bacterium]